MRRLALLACAAVAVLAGVLALLLLSGNQVFPGLLAHAPSAGGPEEAPPADTPPVPEAIPAEPAAKQPLSAVTQAECDSLGRIARQHPPREPIARYPWQKAMRITREAIDRIEPSGNH